MFDDYMALAEGREFNKESITGFYTKMAEHIKQEKQRIGGSNWAVAQAVPFQWLRQHIKEIIGPDCIFVVMSMTEETQASRVEKRHADLDEGMKTCLLPFYILNSSPPALSKASYFSKTQNGTLNNARLLAQ